MIELRKEKLGAALMIVLSLCIVSSNTGKWSNYINSLFIFLWVLYFLFQKQGKIPLLNIGWILFLVIYPILDHAIRGETDLTIYTFLQYATVILFMFNNYAIEELFILNKALALWGVIQSCSIILSNLWTRLYYILAGRMIGYWSARLTGFGVDPAATAIAISMGICIVFLRLFLYRSQMSKTTVKISYVELLIMFYGLIVCGKRLILVVTVLLCMVIVIISASKDFGKFCRVITVCIILLGLGYLLSLFAYRLWGETNALGRLGSTIIGLSSGDDITSNRSVWAGFMNEWKKGHELFGIGWESFPARIAKEGYTTVPNGHNVFLQLLCESGYVGFAFFVTLLLISSFRAFVNCLYFLRKNDPDKLFLAYFSFYSIGLFAFYCLTGNAIYDAFSYYYFFIGVGVISVVSKLRYQNDNMGLRIQAF